MNLKFVSRKLRALLHGEPKPLLFDHIPKCAGSTIREFLFSQYPLEERWEFKGGTPKMIVNEFFALPEEQRANLRLVLGHGAHHVEKHLPESFFRAVIFRDPIDRVVSHYHYVKRRPEHHLHDKVKAGDMTLAQYVASDITDELSNYYTRHILAWDPWKVLDDPAAAAGLALERVVSSYDLIKTLDQMDGFLESLAGQCNLNKNKIPRNPVNVTKNRTPVAAIDQGTRELIESENEADIIFYRLLKAHLSGSRGARD